MAELARCQIGDCQEPAEYSYTSGEDERRACVTCAKRARNVATAMGMHLQIKLWPPVPLDDLRLGWRKLT